MAFKRASLILAVLMAAGATAASAEEFIVSSDKPDQTWFIAPSEEVTTRSGNVRTHVYQVFYKDGGAVLDGRTVQYADFLIEYNCAQGDFHPVAAELLDSEYRTIGGGTFPATGNEIKATGANAWGFGLVCKLPAASGARLNGRDWREVAQARFDAAAGVKE